MSSEENKVSEKKVSRRKYIAYAGAGVVVVAGAAGGYYYTRQPLPWQKRELDVWMQKFHIYECTNELFANFEEEHNVKINVEPFVGWDPFRAKITTSVQAGTPPDIAETANFNPEFGAREWVIPLEDLVKKYDLDLGDFLPVTLERNKYKGKLYGLPMFATALGALYYNTEWIGKELETNKPLKDIWPPKDWEELSEVWKLLTDPAAKKYGTTISADPQFGWWAIFSAGGKFWDEGHRKTLINDEPAFKALSFYQEVIKNGYAPKPPPGSAWPESRRNFTALISATSISGPWDIVSLPKENPDLKWDVEEIPSGPEKQATLLCGVDLCVFKESRNHDLAFQVLLGLTSPEYELLATKQATMTMPRLSWANEPYVQGNRTLQVFAKMVSIAEMFPVIPEYPAFWIDWRKTVWEPIVIEFKDVQNSLDAFEEKANETLEKWHAEQG